MMKKELILSSRDKSLSIRKQCELMNRFRSSLYYQSIGEKPANLAIMQLMDKHILEEPTARVLTMQFMLLDKGIKAGYERIRRLIRKANIRPIYARRHLTVLGEKKYVYPYLLKGLNINHANRVWEIEITTFQWKKVLCTSPQSSMFTAVP